MQFLLNILIWYLLIGLITGPSWLLWCLSHEYVTGTYDPKFGPAWKSSMTYMIAASMMLPLVNILWVAVIRVMIEDYVRNKRKK